MDAVLLLFGIGLCVMSVTMLLVGLLINIIDKHLDTDLNWWNDNE
tara:strand:- start:9500 stop:9634 length:135 start_codon:yes stop_codon:yes gene_type:complete